MNIPIYNISVDLNDNETMMTCISLVTDPAVERDFECFDKAKEPIKFSVTDEDKHCITGVAIRANALIYRYSPMFGEYYVRFEPKTIEDIVYKYSKMNLWNSVSLEHSGDNIDDAVMIEYFIKGNGKNPQGFEDVEDGSLFVTYKITNDELWEKIKNTDEINGFSIEILANLEPTNDVVEEPTEFSKQDEMEALIDEILNEKKNFSAWYTAGELREMMNDHQAYLIKVGNKVIDCQIYALTNGGDGIEVMSLDGGHEWKEINIRDIEKIEVSPSEYEAWDYSSPSYEDFIYGDEIKIKETIVAPAVTVDDYCKQHRWVMLNYNDDLENPHTLSRQCAIIARGITRRGNECVRIFEKYGDSRSVAEGVEGAEIPGYRLLLTKRIQQMRLIDYARPWTEDDINPEGLLNTIGDDGMQYIYTHYSDKI